MAKRLYVGNLPYRCTEQELEELFGRAGKVETVKIIVDTLTGRSRGFGFVEMATEEEADRAVSQINGTPLQDRELVVSMARPQRESGPGGGYGDRGPRTRGPRPPRQRGR